MSTADRIKQWSWKPGQSGNPAGKPKKPRRSFDAVRRLEALGVDPLEEVVSLAQDPALPKPLRLKAWLTLCEYAYPKLAPVVPHEKVSTRLEEVQRSWDTATWDEFKQAFRQELGTLPKDTRRQLEKMDTKGEIGPLVMQVLLRFVEMRHKQAQAPEEGGLKVVKM
jgi:Family of unknown function (DUF5681)